MGLPGFTGPEDRFAPAWRHAFEANKFEIEFLPGKKGPRVEELPFRVHVGPRTVLCVEFRTRFDAPNAQPVVRYGIGLMIPPAESRSLLRDIELVLAATGARGMSVFARRFVLFISSKSKADFADELKNAALAVDRHAFFNAETDAAGIIAGRICRSRSTNSGFEIVLGSTFDMNSSKPCSFIAVKKPGVVSGLLQFLFCRNSLLRDLEKNVPHAQLVRVRDSKP
jgi:hypothetical protein